MNTLIEQTVRFLSRSNSPFIREKSLTPDEIVDLMDKGEEVVNAISKDSKKDKEENKIYRDFFQEKFMNENNIDKSNQIVSFQFFYVFVCQSIRFVILSQNYFLEFLSQNFLSYSQ